MRDLRKASLNWLNFPTTVSKPQAVWKHARLGGGVESGRAYMIIAPVSKPQAVWKHARQVKEFTKKILKSVESFKTASGMEACATRQVVSLFKEEINMRKVSKPQAVWKHARL